MMARRDEGDPRYYRLRLGRNAMYAEQAFREGYVGVDFDFDQDLSGQFPPDWRDFNKKWRMWLMEKRPEYSGVSAGLACGTMWQVGEGIKVGDIVLCPYETNTFRVAEVTGGYQYAPDSELPHRRPVRWLETTLSRDAFSEELWRTIRVPLTWVDLNSYSGELRELMSGGSLRPRISVDDTEVEDVLEFAFESHLEDFIVENWNSTVFGKDYDIYKENGEKGTQISVSGGRLDILAVKKDQSELLVVELKRGRASDPVVGQMLRYISMVEDELAVEGQTVRGVIIALSDDANIRAALRYQKNVEFMRYEIKFNLIQD
jgi:restriction system protein